MPEWYNDVALVILQTMVINIFLPTVGVAVGILVPKVLMYLDSKGTMDKY
jgi:hypothetical protein